MQFSCLKNSLIIDLKITENLLINIVYKNQVNA